MTSIPVRIFPLVKNPGIPYNCFEMDNQTDRSGGSRVEHFGRMQETGAGISVQLSALALALILLALQFICSSDRAGGPRPEDNSAIAPTAIEIRSPADSSEVVLFSRKPSLDGVLGRDGFESMRGNVASGSGEVIAHGSTVELAGTVPNGSVSIYPMEAHKRLALGLKIDINHADLAELTAVPGLSDRRAGRIVRYREERGTIGQLEELVEKRVLNEKTMHRIRIFIKCAL